ncbi:unnamed protein product [Ixodes pacificus]
MLDFESQLKDILKSPSLAKRLFAPQHSLDMTEITNSKAYNKLPLLKGDIPQTWSTDGVLLHGSFAFAVWPLQLAANHLPKNERTKKPTSCWSLVRNQKSDMNCFLDPFVQHMNYMSSQGLSWEDALGVSHVTPAFPRP